MTRWQKAVKYAALAFAIFLAVSIIGGILGAVGLLGAVSDFTDKQDATGNMTAYTVEGPVTDLEIDIRAAALYICEGDSLAVESNLKTLTAEVEKDGCLKVKEKKNKTLSINRSDAVVYLYIPADTSFRDVSITTGAGKVSIETLQADSLSMSLGAGEVTVDRLVADREADIDGGAGALTIRDCTLTDLDLDMGIGELDLTGSLLLESEISLGVGEANLTLTGSASAYSVQVDKGVGAVTVDGESIGNGGVYGSGKNRVEIDGGVGEITVKFAP